MNQFSEQPYELSEELLRSLSLLGYQKPTKIQEMVIPHAMKGENLLVRAKTGSGKTAAFGIPMCESINWDENKPQVLILVPTRELAIQVGEELTNIGRLKRVKVTTVYGRSELKAQAIAIKQKTHIVVGTPGRVIDLIERGDFNVDKIDTVIVDEADEMFFIGLREQVEKILGLVQPFSSMMLFSATLGPDAKNLAAKFMQDPVELSIDEKTVTVDHIAQYKLLVRPDEKYDDLMKVTMDENPMRCMIFANTQKEVEDIYYKLKRKEYQIVMLHGGMQQKERLRMMNAFKRAKAKYLVTTDVAARGIDVDEVNLVINYDMPRGRENYVHRIGRTGRNGKSGKSITFYGEREERALREVEDYTHVAMESMDIPELDASKRSAFYELQEKELEAPKEKNANFKQEVLKLVIHAGKKGKIRPVDIVGTICSIDDVAAEDIGVIRIGERMTEVEILNSKGNHVYKSLQKKTIKGRIRKVTKRGL
ncbi:ATP-dependent RNA helicase YxiN [Lachnospiraceae bacterium KM106-2]|nr:ATP-dependent RNA helicase YxiN [Lachnospiraceae bacterium KM106-2]